MSAKLVEFPIVSKRDLAGTLRAIADEIEQGGYGESGSIELVCVLNNSGDGLRMIWGVNAEGDRVYRLLGLAQYWLNEEHN